tara:strand:- start:504 stop:1130 length:627 start_codon:yes stop_codon:yes gene_type:complete
MKIKIIKDEVRNLDITHLRDISLNSNDWQEPGVSEYQLYAYLSSKVNDSIILDIGTHKGGSALSLSYNERNKIRSYDIKEQGASTIKKDNITWHIGQFTEDSQIDWDNVSIIMLDVGWHTGKEEREMMQFLRDKDWKGILLHDDIDTPLSQETRSANPKLLHMPEILWFDNNNMWNEIPEEKFDLSDIGHCSGTGLVNFGNAHKITVI